MNTSYPILVNPGVHVGRSQIVYHPPSGKTVVLFENVSEGWANGGYKLSVVVMSGDTPGPVVTSDYRVCQLMPLASYGAVQPSGYPYSDSGFRCAYNPVNGTIVAAGSSTQVDSPDPEPFHLNIITVSIALDGTPSFAFDQHLSLTTGVGSYLWDIAFSNAGKLVLSYARWYGEAGLWSMVGTHTGGVISFSTPVKHSTESVLDYLWLEHDSLSDKFFLSYSSGGARARLGTAGATALSVTATLTNPLVLSAGSPSPYMPGDGRVYVSKYRGTFSGDSIAWDTILSPASAGLVHDPQSGYLFSLYDSWGGFLVNPDLSVNPEYVDLFNEAEWVDNSLLLTGSVLAASGTISLLYPYYKYVYGGDYSAIVPQKLHVVNIALAAPPYVPFWTNNVLHLEQG